jgi:hypothetical protein
MCLSGTNTAFSKRKRRFVTTCSGSSRRSRFGSVSGALEGDRKSSARPRVPASNPLSGKTGDGMVPSLNEWPRNPHWPPCHASSAAHPHALRLDAAILSRLRSPVTSRSNTGRAIAIDHPRITPAPARRTHMRTWPGGLPTAARPAIFPSPRGGSRGRCERHLCDAGSNVQPPISLDAERLERD